uniref:Transposon protein, putative, CACTA, En/Spm sub-class n=1 Tax=Oryza sativa subsp. japonica TaxID=39947 RepID=Q339F1_ORYSJ|nr:transposon protein, putative, CACTA, En/Spm sub-class [Oryza sativa Japonica Group]
MKLTMKLSVAFAFFFFLAATTTAFAQCTFEILVKTDGRWYAGTNARVSLQVRAASGPTLTITNLESWGQMAASHDYFEKGNLDRFRGTGDCMPSEPCNMVLTSDGSGNMPGCLCHLSLTKELKVLMLIIASKKCYVMQRTLVTKEKIMRDLPGWLQIRRLLCTYCKPKYTRLSAVLELMKLKTSNGWTDTSFTKLLDMLSDMLPEGNMLAKSTYEAKKPTLGNLSGQSNRGADACSECLEDTHSLWLKSSRKTVYMGHCRFLPQYHPYRNMMEAFNGQREIGVKPRHFTGRQLIKTPSDYSSCGHNWVLMDDLKLKGLEPVVKDGPYAVDMLEQATPCILKVEVIPSFAVEAAKWKAYPPLNTETIHHAQVRDGYARVSVDREARGSFVQWPKKHIIIEIVPHPSDKAPKVPALPSCPPIAARDDLSWDLGIDLDK